MDFLHKWCSHFWHAQHPCIGLGPGNEVYAHAPNEATPIEHLTEAAAFYAALIHQLAQ